MRQTFHKKERLKSEKAIGFLFSGKGHSYAKFPVRIIWAIIDQPQASSFPVQVTFAVPKKRFAAAPKRNLLKRRLRESYRRQKEGLYESLPLAPHEQLAVLFLYTSNEVFDYRKIDKAMNKLLKRLPSEVEKSKH